MVISFTVGMLLWEMAYPGARGTGLQQSYQRYQKWEGPVRGPLVYTLNPGPPRYVHVLDAYKIEG